MGTRSEIENEREVKHASIMIMMLVYYDKYNQSHHMLDLLRDVTKVQN